MLQLILAIKYMFKRRIASLAVLTVALSVFVAFVVLTVMHGLVSGFKDANHAFVGDCVVGTESLVGFAYYDELMERLEALPSVQALSPAVKTYGLFTETATGRRDGIEVMGIDPLRHAEVTDFSLFLHYQSGQVDRVFDATGDANRPGCAFGVDQVLDRDENGDYPYGSYLWPRDYDITCFPLTAKGFLKRHGLGEVSTKRFALTDTVHSGLAKNDAQLMYMALNEAQQLSGMDLPVPRISAIFVRFIDTVPFKQGTHEVSEVFSKFRQDCADRNMAFLLDTVRVRDWKRYCRDMIAPVEKEEIALTFMFVLVGLTTVFIVLVIFHMIISHKSRDIGVLRSMGVSSSQIMGLYWIFALMIGTLGAGAGLGGGWLFLSRINRVEAWLFEKTHFQLFNRAMFAIDEIPHDIDPQMMVVIGLFALLSCWVGALIPAWQAARLQPVRTLQVSQL
ncbi:MAG: FtsX-like permease family protein [Planctomycetes bacterium]|nr:FtsX-like permease family protein [Planctomycetota bacterium]